MSPDHRAALRDSFIPLTILGVSAVGMTTVMLSVLASPGMFSETVHTRIPGLIVASVIAFAAQTIAIIVRYRDFLRFRRGRK